MRPPGVPPKVITIIKAEDVDRTDYAAVVQRYKDKVRNPKTAIRAKCIECSGGSVKEVNLCTVVKCALHPFRMGVNPFNKKTQDRLARETSTDTEAEDDEDEHELEHGENDE